MKDFTKILGIENPTPYEKLKTFDIFAYSDEVDLKDSLGELDVILLNPSKEFLSKNIKPRILSIFKANGKISNEEDFKEEIKQFIIEEFIEFSNFAFDDIEIYINI